MTPWTVAYQAPPSMGFSRQEYWTGLPFPSPGDLPDPRNQTPLFNLVERTFIKKLKVELPYGPATLGHLSRENMVLKDTLMFIAVLLTTAKIWKQRKSPSID